MPQYYMLEGSSVLHILFYGSYFETDMLVEEYLSLIHILRLHSPESAIFSAVIYNAVIIVALIPLALKGVKYREVPAKKLLSRNLLVFGVGGVILPFIAIKLIDMLLVAVGLF